ncbi:MAG: hypothetical protein J6Y80_07640, partial [Victivallales bacterium]|nr:hypothetical protein [Victivallales bacterium]
GLRIEQMNSTGLALLNAFETLQPEAAELPNLQLVVDFGTESSVLAIYCQGRIQLLANLAAGAARPADGESATHDLAREIQNVLGEWKNTQPTDTKLLTSSQVWLSGEGALNAETAEVLSAQLQTPVQLLGPAARKCAAGIPTGGAVGGVCPALTIALGLALQGTGTAPCMISLVPERLTWQQRKKKSAPYLALTAMLLAFALVAGLHLFNRHLRNAFAELQQHDHELDEALALCPQLDQAYQDLAYHQRRILPVAETGFRTQRFMETIQVWLNSIPDHTEQDTWCFYLADEFSFANANAAQATSQRTRDDDAGERSSRSRPARAVETPAVTPPRPPALLSTETQIASEEPGENAVRPPLADAENAAEAAEPAPVVYPATTLVAQIPVLSAMYVGGFVPSIGNKYQLVKQLQERLNISDTFVNVDDYADFLGPEFKDAHLLPWQNFLVEHRDDIGQEHLLFFLQLPFREAPVKRPAN